MPTYTVSDIEAWTIRIAEELYALLKQYQRDDVPFISVLAALSAHQLATFEVFLKQEMNDEVRRDAYAIMRKLMEGIILLTRGHELNPPEETASGSQ